MVCLAVAVFVPGKFARFFPQPSPGPVVSEFSKGAVHFGYLNNQRLENKELMELADLPSIEVLRAKIAGLLQAPATKLARLISTPGQQLARVLQARVDKEQQAA